jgi:DNA-binding CsgD family transcriptional regulator
MAARRKERVTDVTLSPRQAQIVRLLDRGMTQAEIAEVLGIHRRSVEDHVAKLRKKTGSTTTRQALSRVRPRALGPRS